MKGFKHILSGVPAVLALATDVTKSVASAKTAGYSIGKLFTALPGGATEFNDKPADDRVFRAKGAKGPWVCVTK